MARITGEVVIDAAITEVFDTVADERNEPRYNPRIVRAEMLTDEPVRAGSRFVAEPKGMGARGQMAMEMYLRPHRLHNVIRSSYMHVDGTITFAETEDGTRLRWDWTMRLLGPMIGVVEPTREISLGSRRVGRGLHLQDRGARARECRRAGAMGVAQDRV